MIRSGVSSTTSTTIGSDANWGTKEKPDAFAQKELISKNEPIQAEIAQSARTGGFYDKRTLWEQELYRYHPSFWLLVRVGSLIAFPYITSSLGRYVYPQVVAIAQANDLETQTAALPMIGLMNLSAFLVHGALYGILYHYEPTSFEKYRVDEKPWHWDMEPDKWKEMLCNTMGLVMFNFLGLTFPLAYLNAVVFGLPVRLDVESLPSGLEVFWQLLFCLFCEDFLFHHAHQLLHTKRFYWIHKVHHQYHAPIAVSAAYAHPIEYLFGNILPSALGGMILQKRMHLWSMSIWAIFRLSAALENHSGYEFPWSMYQAIPFKAPTEYHDFHHNRNQGTYSGVLRFWDWVYGTNCEYFEWVRAGRPETLKSQKFKQQQKKKD